MVKINDLNLKDWKEKIIKIYGDEYKIRKTYDIDDFGIGRYGFDVCNENNDFLCYFTCDKINTLKQYIKTTFYEDYEN